MVSDGNETYEDLFNEIFRAVIRKLRGHPYSLDFPLTVSQRASADRLVRALLNPASTKMQDADFLQDFAWDLVSEKRTQAWGNIFQFILAFLALRVDGTYTCATNLSPELAKIKYFIRTTCMTQTLRQPQDAQTT